MATMDGAATATGEAHHIRTTANYRGGVAADAADHVCGATDGAAQETQNIAGAGTAGHF